MTPERGFPVAEFTARVARAQALMADQGDVSMLVGGAPLSQINYQGDKFNLISLGGDYQRLLTSRKFPYKKTRLEKGIYSWLQEDIETISIASVIVAHKKADAKQIKKLVRKISKYHKKLRRIHPKWDELDVEYAKFILKAHKEYAHKSAYKAVKKMRKRRRR